MLTFLDGPAARETLMCRRAPLFLRVVFNPRAKKEPWDALDQLTDEPKPHEEIHVYRRVTLGSPIHWKCSGSEKKNSGFFAVASYRLLGLPPTYAVMRDTVQWQEWCALQVWDEVVRGHEREEKPTL